MAPKNQTEISILEITQSQVRFAVLGRTPIILYRMPEKAMHELLMPKGRKTAADKASNLKHKPFEEFRSSPYRIVDNDAPTLLAHVSTAFKKAIAGAATDIPGAAKAQIGRLLWVEGEKVPIYGIPKLHMSITRSADMNHTPDVRTRCIVPEWAAYVTISYTTPILKEPVVANLFAAAGLIQGVGDWRPQKGSGTFGQFALVNDTDEAFARIVKTGGRAAQIEAMEAAVSYDAETDELLSWFVDEAEKRGHKEVGR